MAFNLGQFRRDMLAVDNYISNLAYSITTVDVDTDTSLGVTFKDQAIVLTGKSFEYGINYYLKVGIKRDIDYNQTIIINLQNDNATQTLETYTIPRASGTTNSVAIIELVISPNNSYDKIVFTLQRNAQDYTITNPDGSSGRLLTIVQSDTKVATINNILSILGINSLTKIGVQGPPGLLMCINGEDIRIGPSGIYEIKNGYKVTFIGFIIQNSDDTPDKKDYFILDYQY